MIKYPKISKIKSIISKIVTQHLKVRWITINLMPKLYDLVTVYLRHFWVIEIYDTKVGTQSAYKWPKSTITQSTHHLKTLNGFNIQHNTSVCAYLHTNFVV